MGGVRVRRFRGEVDLGRFRRRYRVSIYYRLIAIMVAAIVLVPFAFDLMTRRLGAEGSRADVVLALIGAPLVIWVSVKAQEGAVALHDEGIECFKGRRKVQIRWKDIHHLRYRFRGARGEPDQNVTYRCVDTFRGQHIELEGLAGIDELWAAIERGVDEVRRRSRHGTAN
jgi:hypothetical protein